MCEYFVGFHVKQKTLRGLGNIMLIGGDRLIVSMGYLKVFVTNCCLKTTDRCIATLAFIDYKLS